VPPHVADQQRLEQQWAAETLRPSALYEAAAARPARVAPYPAPAAGAAYAAPAAAAARDGGEYGGGYGDARGGGYGDARGGGGRGDWEAAYAGNGYAGGGGRAGPRSSGGGGGYAAAARGGDPNLVMEMEADDAAQGYQEEEGRYGGVLAPVRLAPSRGSECVIPRASAWHAV